MTLELEKLGWIALVIWAISLWATRFSRRSLRTMAALLWLAIVALHVGLHFILSGLTLQAWQHEREELRR